LLVRHKLTQLTQNSLQILSTRVQDETFGHNLADIQTDKPNDNVTNSCSNVVDFSFPKAIENLDFDNVFYQSYNGNNFDKVEKFSSQVGFHFQETANMFIKIGDFPILESVSVPRVDSKLNAEKLQQCQTRLARRILNYKKSWMAINSSSPSTSNSNDPIGKLWWMMMILDCLTIFHQLQGKWSIMLKKDTNIIDPNSLFLNLTERQVGVML